MRRRTLVHSLLGGGAAALLGARATGPRNTGHARVVVLGGGVGGATAAHYLRTFSGNTLGVVLVEPNTAFLSCPMSTLVVAGVLPLASVTRSYRPLQVQQGVTVVHDSVQSIDIARKTVQLARGNAIRYDKLVL